MVQRGTRYRAFQAKSLRADGRPYCQGLVIAGRVRRYWVVGVGGNGVRSAACELFAVPWARRECSNIRADGRDLLGEDLVPDASGLIERIYPRVSNFTRAEGGPPPRPAGSTPNLMLGRRASAILDLRLYSPSRLLLMLRREEWAPAGVPLPPLLLRLRPLYEAELGINSS